MIDIIYIFLLWLGIENMNSIKKKRCFNSEMVNVITHITVKLPDSDENDTLLCGEKLQVVCDRVSNWNQNNKEIAKHVEDVEYKQFHSLIGKLDEYVAQKSDQRQPLYDLPSVSDTSEFHLSIERPNNAFDIKTAKNKILIKKQSERPTVKVIKKPNYMPIDFIRDINNL